jgi:hypothetical protein
MFAELDKTSVVAAKDIEAKNLSLITNMPIDDKFFDRHSAFFASIGYIALQVAQIEDEIRQSMIAMTDDLGAVDDQTKGKNLGALLSLYEIVFLAKFSGENNITKCFQALKPVVAKANKYRNVAVHQNWMFIDGDPERPCFFETKNKEEQYVVVTPALMRERAMFTHATFQYMNDLRALTEGPDGWSPDTVKEAHRNFEELAQGRLRMFRS